MCGRLLRLLLVFLSACVPMGEPCEEASECTGGGSCIKGVCSAYSCSSDNDCKNGYQCELVFEVKICALHCESDDDCFGEQKCTQVTPDIEGNKPIENYCM